MDHGGGRVPLRLDLVVRPPRALRGGGGRRAAGGAVGAAPGGSRVGASLRRWCAVERGGGGGGVHGAGIAHLCGHRLVVLEPEPRGPSLQRSLSLRDDIGRRERAGGGFGGCPRRRGSRGVERLHLLPERAEDGIQRLKLGDLHAAGHAGIGGREKRSRVEVVLGGGRRGGDAVHSSGGRREGRLHLLLRGPRRRARARHGRNDSRGLGHRPGPGRAGRALLR
mmetsp:Transcript_5654/g.25505  ORF Transcript_5654/g.25505 Transcript_5654/m.25505 type:complete len:223 (-) Transcript_5654:1868-2536(-)